MEPSSSPAGYYIPAQLYESLFLFITFGVCTFLYYKNVTIIPQIYLISYGVWRFIIEFFRTDYRGGLTESGALSPSQIQSIIFVVAGVILFFVYKKFKVVFKTKTNDCNFLEKDNV